jgi:hypothetical protein
MTADWRDINLANWESRVPVHTGPVLSDSLGEHGGVVVRHVG